MRRKITDEIWQQVKTAFAAGVGLREIARNMGIPEGSVLSRAKREGWTQQIQSAKTLAVTPVKVVLALPPAIICNQSMQSQGQFLLAANARNN